MSAKVVCHNLRRLLFLCEISTLVEATRARRVHEEVRRPVQFDDKTTGTRRTAIGTGYGFPGFQLYAFDVCKWKFDLVTSRVVVDVVGETSLVRRIKDDEVHGVLADASPGADAQRAASEMVDN